MGDPILNPTGADEEDFTVALDEQATKSKFVFDNGKYQAVCTDLAKTTAKSGNLMYVFTFIGTGGAAKGLEFFARCSLQPNAQWKLAETMKGFGVVPDPTTRVLPIKKANVVGKNVTLVLEQQEYGNNGKVSMSVEQVLPPSADVASTPASAGAPF